MGLTGVMNKLKNASAEQLAQLFPNIRGLRGFIAALTDATGFAKDLEVMTNRLGSTQEAYGKIADTTAFALERWNQAVSVLKGLLTEGLLSGFKRFIDTFVDGMAAIRAVDPGILQLQKDILDTRKKLEAAQKGGFAASIANIFSPFLPSEEELKERLRQQTNLFRLLTKGITAPERVEKPKVEDIVPIPDAADIKRLKDYKEAIGPIFEMMPEGLFAQGGAGKSLKGAWSGDIFREQAEAAATAVTDLQRELVFVGDDIVMGWSNTMSGLMQGTMNFRDFSRQMFADVTSSFIGMASRIAAEKLFGATLGKASFFGGGGGGWGLENPTDYKYRVSGRKALMG
jgi:hypothetical protein